MIEEDPCRRRPPDMFPGLWHWSAGFSQVFASSGWHDMCGASALGWGHQWNGRWGQVVRFPLHASDYATASGFLGCGNWMNWINCKANILDLLWVILLLIVFQKSLAETIFKAAVVPSRISCWAVTQLHRRLLLQARHQQQLLATSATSSQFPPHWHCPLPAGFLQLLLLWAMPVIWHSWEVTFARAYLRSANMCSLKDLLISHPCVKVTACHILWTSPSNGIYWAKGRKQPEMTVQDNVM